MAGFTVRLRGLRFRVVGFTVRFRGLGFKL